MSIQAHDTVTTASTTSIDEICHQFEQHSLCIQMSQSKSERNASTQYLMDFRNSPSPYTLCFHILRRGASPTAQHYALTTIKEAVLREWGTAISPTDALSISDNLLQYILEYSHSGKQLSTFVVSQLFHVVTIIRKRDWPVGPLRNVEGDIYNGMDMPLPTTVSYHLWDFDTSTTAILPVSNTTETANIAGVPTTTISITSRTDIEKQVIAELERRSETATNTLLERMQPFLSAQGNPLLQELGGIFASSIVSEFSAPHSSSLGPGIPWSFHVCAHNAFDKYISKPLFTQLTLSIAIFAPFFATPSLNSVSKVVQNALLRILLAIQSILSFSFDERNSLPESVRTMLNDTASFTEEIRAVVLNTFNSTVTITQGMKGAQSQSLDDILQQQITTPGVLWAPILLHSGFLKTLLQLYQAIVGGLDIEFSARGRHSYGLQRCAETLLHILVQFGSLSGTIFSSESVFSIIPTAIHCILQEPTERTKTLQCTSLCRFIKDSTMMLERPGLQQLVGYGEAVQHMRQIYGADDSTIGTTSNVQTPTSLSRYFDQMKELFLYFIHRLESYPIDQREEHGLFAKELQYVSQLLQKICQRMPLHALLAGEDTSVIQTVLRFIRIVLTPDIIVKFGETRLDTWGSETWEILLETCSVLAYKRNNPTAISVLSMNGGDSYGDVRTPSMSRTNSTCDDLAAGYGSYSDYNSSSYILRAVTNSSTGSPTASSSTSTSVSSKSSSLITPQQFQFLDNSLLQVVTYYIELKLSICQGNDRSNGNGVSNGSVECDYEGGDDDDNDGDEQFQNNVNTEHVIRSLASLSRINPAQVFGLITPKIQHCVNTLQSILTNSSTTTYDQATSTAIVGYHESLWFLFQFLLHILCIHDEGETPSIPVELLAYSSKYHEAYATQYQEAYQTTNQTEDPVYAPLDPLLEAIAPVFEYLAFEKNVLFHSFMTQEGGHGQSLNSSATSSAPSVLSSTKPEIISPYVAQSVLQLVKVWVKTYLHPQESMYARISPGLWNLCGIKGAFVPYALDILFQKIIVNIFLWGEESQVSQTTCQLFAQITSQRSLQPIILRQHKHIRELITILKISYFRDSISLASIVPVLLEISYLPQMQIDNNNVGNNANTTSGYSVPDYIQSIIDKHIAMIHSISVEVLQQRVIEAQQSQDPFYHEVMMLQKKLLCTSIRLNVFSVCTLQSSLLSLVTPPNQLDACTVQFSLPKNGNITGTYQQVAVEISRTPSLPSLSLFCELLRPCHTKLQLLMQQEVLQFLQKALLEAKTAIVASNTNNAGNITPTHLLTPFHEIYTSINSTQLVRKFLKQYTTQDFTNFLTQTHSTIALFSSIIPTYTSGSAPLFAAFLWQWLSAILTSWQSIRLITSVLDSAFLSLFRKIASSELLTYISSAHLAEYIYYIHNSMVMIYICNHHDLSQLLHSPFTMARHYLQSNGHQTAYVHPPNTVNGLIGAPIGSWYAVASNPASYIPKKYGAALEENVSKIANIVSNHVQKGLTPQEALLFYMPRIISHIYEKIDIPTEALDVFNCSGSSGDADEINNDETKSHNVASFLEIASFGESANISDDVSDIDFTNYLYAEPHVDWVGTAGAATTSSKSSKSSTTIPTNFIAHAQRLTNDLYRMYDIFEDISSLKSHRIHRDDDTELYALFNTGCQALEQAGLIASAVDNIPLTLANISTHVNIPSSNTPVTIATLAASNSFIVPHKITSSSIQKQISIPFEQSTVSDTVIHAMVAQSVIQFVKYVYYFILTPPLISAICGGNSANNDISTGVPTEDNGKNLLVEIATMTLGKLQKILVDNVFSIFKLKSTGHVLQQQQQQQQQQQSQSLIYNTQYLLPQQLQAPLYTKSQEYKSFQDGLLNQITSLFLHNSMSSIPHGSIETRSFLHQIFIASNEILYPMLSTYNTNLPISCNPLTSNGMSQIAELLSSLSVQASTSSASTVSTTLSATSSYVGQLLRKISEIGAIVHQEQLTLIYTAKELLMSGVKSGEDDMKSGVNGDSMMIRRPVMRPGSSLQPQMRTNNTSFSSSSISIRQQDVENLKLYLEYHGISTNMLATSQDWPQMLESILPFSYKAISIRKNVSSTGAGIGLNSVDVANEQHISLQLYLSFISMSILTNISIWSHVQHQMKGKIGSREGGLQSNVDTATSAYVIQHIPCTKQQLDIVVNILSVIFYSSLSQHSLITLCNYGIEAKQQQQQQQQQPIIVPVTVINARLAAYMEENIQKCTELWYMMNENTLANIKSPKNQSAGTSIQPSQIASYIVQQWSQFMNIIIYKEQSQYQNQYPSSVTKAKLLKLTFYTSKIREKEKNIFISLISEFIQSLQSQLQRLF